MLHSDEPRTLQLNIRLNPAEKLMIERLQSSIRPRVSASRLLIYLCEEEARKRDLIEDEGDGTWTISEEVSRTHPNR